MDRSKGKKEEKGRKNMRRLRMNVQVDEKRAKAIAAKFVSRYRYLLIQS